VTIPAAELQTIMPLGFKVSSKKKTTGASVISAAKSVDQLDASPEEQLAEANEKLQTLEKELAECKAELHTLKESAGKNGDEIAALKQQMSEVTSENTDLNKVIKELRGENSDMRKVFGSLDDLGELRHQYEGLFDDDFKSSNTDIAIDIDSSNNPAASAERREKTRAFCNDLKTFLLDVRTNSLGGQ
jgi:chromosome segregation ATPase